jgi:hypothetical protein
MTLQFIVYWWHRSLSYTDDTAVYHILIQYFKLLNWFNLQNHKILSCIWITATSKFIKLTERTNKMQPCSRIIIPVFFNCSTCFGQHTAHHQELKNCNCSLWFYIHLWLLAAVMAEPSQQP